MSAIDDELATPPSPPASIDLPWAEDDAARELVASHGPLTLAEIGALYGVTGEAVRKIEASAIANLARRLETIEAWPDPPDERAIAHRVEALHAALRGFARAEHADGLREAAAEDEREREIDATLAAEDEEDEP